MAKVTPAEMAEKWARRLSGSTEDIKRGIQNVQVAPGRLAAAQADVWLAKLQQSKDKWASRVGGVSLEAWKDKAINVGVPRIASGAQANVSKVEAFAGEFLPHLDRGVQNVKTMPKATLEDGINRAIAMMRHNAQFRRGGGR